MHKKPDRKFVVEAGSLSIGQSRDFFLSTTPVGPKCSYDATYQFRHLQGVDTSSVHVPYSGVCFHYYSLYVVFD